MQSCVFDLAFQADRLVVFDELKVKNKHLLFRVKILCENALCEGDGLHLEVGNHIVGCAERSLLLIPQFLKRKLELHELAIFDIYLFELAIHALLLG